MKIEADDTTLVNVAVANSANGYNQSAAGQSVALDIESDRVALHATQLLGGQDTLYTGRRRAYFADLFINGTCDAIFGNGASVFERATIRMLYTVAAHKGEAWAGPGKAAYLFLDSDVDSLGGVPADLLLGRPWGPNSTVVWVNTVMGAGVSPPGWDDWGHGCTAAPHVPGTSWCNQTFYAEYNSSGVGAHPGERVWWSTQLSESEAANWTVEAVLGDWTPPSREEAEARGRGTPPPPGSSVVRGGWLVVDPGDKTCDVTAYGAKGDGVTDDTTAVQAALTDCASGGTLLLPSGRTFLTSGVAASNLGALVVSVRGTWLFSNDTAGWDQHYSSCMAFKGGQALALTGGGLVDGNGFLWWAEAGKAGFRPGLVKTGGIQEVLVTGLTFKDSPNHNLELFSDRQEVYNVTITASPPCQDPPNPNRTFCAHNTDAVDTHNSDAAWVHSCSFSVGDDNVAIHGNNTLVEDCTFGYGHGASIGSLGQDTYLQNITVRSTSFNGTEQAVRIKSDPGATGFLRDVLFTNLTMTGVGQSILVTMFYPAPNPGVKTSLKINDVTFSDIVSFDSAFAGQFLCAPESPCNVTVANVHHTGTPPPTGWQCQAAHGTATDVTPPLCLQPV